jgi:hypothetical protein
MNNFVTIEIDRWGVMFSTEPYYFSISWGGFALIAVVIMGLRLRKVLKTKRNK